MLVSQVTQMITIKIIAIESFVMDIIKINKNNILILQIILMRFEIKYLKIIIFVI